MSDEILSNEPSKKKLYASNLTAAFAIILCGVFILLCGLDVIPLGIELIIAPAILSTIALVLLAGALIQRNVVSLYLGALFIVFALTSFIANFANGVSYAELYPLYIAAPAFASLITMLMSGNFSAHIKAAVVFGLLAAVFFMQSFDIWNWGVTIAALIIFIGLIAIYVAMGLRKSTEE